MKIVTVGNSLDSVIDSSTDEFGSVRTTVSGKIVTIFIELESGTIMLVGYEGDTNDTLTAFRIKDGKIKDHRKLVR